jgi:dihydropteridine reductase
MAAATLSASSMRALVYGGSGALGKAVVSAFKQFGVSVDSVDFSANSEATNNWIVDGKFEESLTKVVQAIEAESAKVGGAVYDVIVCAAGGWAGGDLKGNTHDLLASVEKMYAMNLQSALATSHIAAKFLKAGGLVVLTGANAARSGTSGMIGYGLSKSATHQLAQSLQATFTSDKSGSAVVSILPVTLDTPSNRSAMPNANFSTWTPLADVAGNIVSWASQPNTRPTPGAMLSVETKDNITSWTPVHTEY